MSIRDVPTGPKLHDVDIIKVYCKLSQHKHHVITLDKSCAVGYNVADGEVQLP